ncbi:MAG: hypothetical protein ACOX45_02160 [Acutalibacteraceae bacterium]
MMKLNSPSELRIPPQCRYCTYGRTTADGTNVLCIKKGVMLLNSRCRKYKYDPLKREPRQKPEKPEFSKEDFSL